MEATVGALAAGLGGEVIGDAGRVVTQVQSLRRAGPDAITFFGEDASLRALDNCRAGAMLISRSRLDEIAKAKESDCSWIVVHDAQDAFIEILKTEHPPRPRASIGLSEHAQIAESAQIDENTNVFPGSFIGEEVVIGKNCDIYPGAFIGDGVRIGDNVTIHPQVVVYADVEIGSRVTVHAGAVIGADGFGYRFRDDRFEKIPQLGTVRIEDDVEIGAGTTIDGGTIEATRIGAGTKLDNLVMIAHNCQIGRHNAFASQTGIAGSSTTGDYVRAGGQAGIRDHVNVGEGASLGAASALLKDVPPGETWAGTPARRQDEAFRILNAQSKLPDMRQRIRQLENQVETLTGKLNELATVDRAA